MNLSPKLQSQSNRLIVQLQGKDVVIVSESGICIASTDEKKIGHRIFSNSLLSKTNSYHATHFLKCRTKNCTIMIWNDQRHNSLKDRLLLQKLTELTIQKHLENLKLSSDSVDQFITRLINNRWDRNKIASFEAEARSLGLNTLPKRTAVVLYVKNFETTQLLLKNNDFEKDELIKDYKKKITSTIESFFTQNSDIITAYLGNNKFVVFKAITQANERNFVRYMKKAHQSIFGPLKTQENELSIGFGNAYAGVQGLIDAYHEANQALELGKKLDRNNSDIYFFNDLNELRILCEQDNRKKAAYAEEIVGKLEDPALKKTLEKFLEENLHLVHTASKLNIHPNTVLYRLGKIERILGLDPRQFDHAAALKMALMTKRFLS